MHLKLSKVVHRSKIFFTKGWRLKIASLVVVWFFNATYRSYPKRLIIFLNLDNRGSTQIVNIWRNPSTVIQITQQDWGFVIASDKDCQKWCQTLSCIILMKVTHLSKFRWTCESFKIGLVSYALKIATTNDQIYLLRLLL